MHIFRWDHCFINRLWMTLAFFLASMSTTGLCESAPQTGEQLEVIPYCIHPDWLPYEAIVDGKHVGISADYLQLVAVATGYQFKLIVTDNWPQSLAYLQQGKCSMTPFLNKTSDREHFLLFSDIYFEAPNVLVSLKSQPFLQGFNDIGERTLAIAAGYQLVEYVQRHYPQIKLVLAANEKEGLEQVARGDVDVFVGSMLLVNTYIKQRELTELKIAGWGGPADKLRYGVTLDLHYVLPKFNHALRGITEEQGLAIYHKWNNVSVIENIDYQAAVQVLVLLGGIIFVLLYRDYNIRMYSQALEAKNKLLDDLRLSLEQKNHELDFLSLHDPLTQLYNRHYFNSHYVDKASSEHSDDPMCLIIMDVDYFKLINDNFGHHTGDDVLSKLAYLLKITVRGTDIVTRWGGEEFMILCPKLGLHSAYELCQRLSSQMKQAEFGEGIKVTCSFGIAKLKLDESMMDCLDRADKALYQAKSGGRNQICTEESLNDLTS